MKDDKNGLDRGDADFLFDEEYENYFDNVKVVLFSYTPDDDNSEKGFTLLLIANDDVPKALMEQKSEKDDLHTALKLLINQHFTIDQEYKKQSLKEQGELIDILSQTMHSIKNSFENFKEGDKLDTLKEKVLAIIEQDKKQMEEQGRDAVEKKYEKKKDSLENSLNFIKSLFTSTISTQGNSQGKSEYCLSKKFSKESNEPWDFFAQKIFDLKIENLQTNRIYTIIWKGEGRPKPTLKLTIDFNELQDFSMEWKESLFNDAIYVMLKNACEHSMETFTAKDKVREIFLDVYRSETDDGEWLNIEFTNSTGPICKDIFEHINSATITKNNSRKENSTGIGVVTIRKRLDATYGLDKANMRFTMIGKDKIKSLLYFPIKSIKNDSVFLDPKECEQDSYILYLEDSADYFKKNMSKFKEKKIEVMQKVRFEKDYSYEKFKILITDINIYGETENDKSDRAVASNGVRAIQYFTEKNRNGIVIIVSSETEDVKEKKNQFNGYEFVEEIENLNELQSKHIYFYNKKGVKTT